jgi:hypothetical protein
MNLSTTEFSEFTMPTQNHQWNGLYRHNNTVLTNMSLLRDTLSHLLYDNKRVEERINIANKSIEGLGQGIISVLLFIAHPKDFSPWTSVTGSGLTNLGVMGRIQGKTLGDRYVFVNNIITRLCNASAMTRWEIDSIWTLIPYVYAEF